MAVRPVFKVLLNEHLFGRENIEFVYFNGLAPSQKRKSIASLHQEYVRQVPDANILEISSKSENELGVKLSAFNLMIKGKPGEAFSVESAYHASKVFEKGGPYLDLLEVRSRKAKRDERLKTSGKLVGYNYFGKIFEAEPKSFFYTWLYINTLHLQSDLADEIIQYDAFTDIEFNPKRSLNCQAEAAAIYVSLRKQGLLKKALRDEESFKKLVYRWH